MGSLRVLIIEEELIISEYLLFSLQEKGYEVVGTPCSIDEALREFAGATPDIVILDAQMQEQPDMIEAARTIRREFHMDIPIVFLTTIPLKDLKTGQHTLCVSKPFSEQQLYAAIESALDHRGGSQNEI